MAHERTGGFAALKLEPSLLKSLEYFFSCLPHVSVLVCTPSMHGSGLAQILSMSLLLVDRQHDSCCFPLVVAMGEVIV